MTRAIPRQPASLHLMAGALFVYSGAQLLNNTLLERPEPKQVLETLQLLSGGWIEPVLVRSWVVLAAFLFVVVGLGGRRMSDLGWSAHKLVPGLLIFAASWAALQLVLAGFVLARGGALALHPMWARLGSTAVLGGVLAQAGGHALVEDTAFRAFFLPELRARFARPASLLAGALGIALCVFASALLFGIAHLPTRALTKGSELAALLSEQRQFLLAGLALGLAFVTTRNLFVVVGLHVLLNAPAPLVDVPGALLNEAVLLVFAGVVILSAGASLRAWWRARHAGVQSDDSAESRQRAA